MQHNYKVGDKLICTKTLDTSFTKGYSYTVSISWTNKVMFIDNNGEEHICSDKDWLNYFEHTIKKQRRDKLQKIYDERY